MIRRMMFSAVLLGLLACQQDVQTSHESKHELKLVTMEKKTDLMMVASWQQHLPSFSQGYYPNADPASDFMAAMQQAGTENKVIMMVVGGDWCSWCHVMTRFFSENDRVRQLLLSNFVLLKVNMSEDNENDEFLSNYPAIKGYPHIFILSSKGELLASINTAKLESGQSYSVDKFTTLLASY